MFQALAQNTDLKERLCRIHAESLLLDPPAAAKSGDSLAEVGKASCLVTSPWRPMAPSLSLPPPDECCSRLHGLPQPRATGAGVPRITRLSRGSAANCILKLLLPPPCPPELFFPLYFFPPFSSKLLPFSLGITGVETVERQTFSPVTSDKT